MDRPRDPPRDRVLRFRDGRKPCSEFVRPEERPADEKRPRLDLVALALRVPAKRELPVVRELPLKPCRAASRRESAVLPAAAATEPD